MYQEKSFERKHVQAAAKEAVGITELVNDRVLALIKANLRKFVKIFTYLKIRTDIRAMDDQVKQHRQTNPARAVESQIIIC